MIRLGEAALGEVGEDALIGSERGLLAGVGSARRRAELVAGRVAAHRALASLLGAPVEVLADPDGRPVAAGTGLAISITHDGRRAVAAAGAVIALGVDLCALAEAPRLALLATRFGGGLGTTPWELAAGFAALEAAAKALGAGVLALLDTLPPVRVISLDPPLLYPERLLLQLVRFDDAALAVAWDPGSGFS